MSSNVKRGRIFDSSTYVDLLGDKFCDATSSHYTDQWGDEKGYVDFILNSPAIRHTMGRKLGWPDLFEKIRNQAHEREVIVYDAACGFGGVFYSLFESLPPKNLIYLGADIRKGLEDIKISDQINDHNIQFVRWDISNKLPTDHKFDYIICRQAIHHTPDPQKTFRSLCASLKPQGTIAISAYAKKSRMREALDDRLREEISQMSCQEGFECTKEFTELGRALQEVKGTVHIQKDLNFLQIPRGEYELQDLIYRYIVKCWYNEEFGEKHSHIVNYDWYHPSYAYRYSLEDIKQWFEAEGIQVNKMDSHHSQHYIEGIKQ